jgi:hypothetical protein
VFSRARAGGLKALFVGLMVGLLLGMAMTLLADNYHDNNLFIHGSSSVLELSARGAASDIRSWALGSVGDRGARLFINFIGQPGDADTIINGRRGSVGIGTTNPREKLHVVGNLLVEGDIYKRGRVSFVEDHATNPSKQIVYDALEGPEVGTYIRGTSQLVNGEAVIRLPDHFSLVTSEKGLTVQLTPLGEWLQLYVAEQNTQQLVIHEASGKMGSFHYLVQGVRRGYENDEVIKDRQ